MNLHKPSPELEAIMKRIPQENEEEVMYGVEQMQGLKVGELVGIATIMAVTLRILDEKLHGQNVASN